MHGAVVWWQNNVFYAVVLVEFQSVLLALLFPNLIVYLLVICSVFQLNLNAYLPVIFPVHI